MEKPHDFGFLCVEAFQQGGDLLAILNLLGRRGRFRLSHLLHRKRGGGASGTAGVAKPSTGHTSGDHGHVGGEARSTGKTFEHSSVVSQDLEKHIRHEVVSIGIRERKLPTLRGFGDHMRHEARKLRDKRFPAPSGRVVGQARIDELPVGR